MKRFLVVLGVAVVIGLASTATPAAVVVDFDAVALRAANSGQPSGPWTFPAVTEDSDGSGMTASDLVAGQKAYFGTDYFNGQSLTSISSVQFTRSPVFPNAPYLNLLAYKADGSYSVLAAGAPTSSSGNTLTYDFGLAIWNAYEGTGATVLTGPVTLAGLASDGWALLPVGATRALKTGEDAVPNSRAATTDALAIFWGDSQNNYLGTQHIYDVTVTGVKGETYVAGAVPEPASLIVWSLLGIIGVAFSWRRRRAA